MLQRYAERNGLKCRTLDDFIESVFYSIGYDMGGTIVGLNLPFDISRIARGQGPRKTASRVRNLSA